MKEHLIKKNSKNKFLIISHRIILGVLFVILIYEVIYFIMIKINIIF